MAYAFYTKVQKVRPHSNADRLDVATVFGMDTIVTKDTWKAGDYCIYFANGGVISSQYLAVNNMYRHSELNADKAVAGYFEDNGRVKTMKLRGEMSDGIIMRPESLYGFVTPGEVKQFADNWEIDKIGNFTLAQKYIPRYKKGPSGAGNAKRNKKKLIPEHIDTNQLNYNLRRFEGPCEVSISYKLHGTSGRFAALRRPWWKFWAPKFVSGSRRVEFLSFNDKNGGFYGTNQFRKDYHDKLAKIIPPGYTLYFEIVGWVNEDTPIMPIYNTNKLDKELQKEFGPQMIFSYGCEQGKNEIYLYRVTYDDRELSPEEIFKFGEKYNIPVVPFCVIPSRPGWHDWTQIDGVEELEEALQYQFQDYRDRLDPSHLLEGVVVRRKNELGTWEAYKLKTNEFKIIDDIENSGMKPDDISQDVLEEMS